MNTFDIIISALLIFGFIRGLLKGLFVEIASLAALILGVYGAIHFSYFASNILKGYVSWDEKYLTIVAFALTFAVIVIVIALLGKLLTKIANFAALGFLNKLLGGVFGALKIGLILSVVLLIFNKLNNTIPFLSQEQQNETILYEPIKNLAPTLFPNFIHVMDSEKQTVESKN
jgi:membrane protein required for colicin V production